MKFNVNQTLRLLSRIKRLLSDNACLLYSSSIVPLVFDHADTMRHIQRAGKMDRCSSRVACRPSLACAHVFCPLFCRSPKIRGNSRSIKLGYFMCKYSLPLPTLLLNLRPHFKNEFDLFHHPFTSDWED